MPNKEEKKINIVRPLKPNNFVSHPVTTKGMDFSACTRENYHLERDGHGLKVVSDGITDYKELIKSQECNAGLQNIMRLQIMRYGTIENAIIRNKEKQVFADVSKIPTSIAEQTEYVKSVQADVDELCVKLGISKEDLLKANQQFLSEKLAELNKTANNEGGNE